MIKTVYYNYLIAENESIIKTLSDLVFLENMKFLMVNFMFTFKKMEKIFQFQK